MVSLALLVSPENFISPQAVCYFFIVFKQIFFLLLTATWGINEIGPITVYILLQLKSATFDGISTKIITDSGPSIKLLIGVLIRDAPDPPNPPNGGGQSIFWGGG